MEWVFFCNFDWWSFGFLISFYGFNQLKPKLSYLSSNLMNFSLARRFDTNGKWWFTAWIKRIGKRMFSEQHRAQWWTVKIKWKHVSSVLENVFALISIGIQIRHKLWAGKWFIMRYHIWIFATELCLSLFVGATELELNSFRVFY